VTSARSGFGRPTGDDGVVVVLVLGLASVLVLIGMVTSALAAVAVARQRAASAADLSALAAAQSVIEGEAVACARAAALAERVSARLLSCRLTGDLAEVVAEVRPPGGLGALGAARSRARAGPGLTTSTTAGTRARGP
jgi:secretion/DNA translocation related TadE-like protein